MSIKSQELERAKFAYDWIYNEIENNEEINKSEDYKKELEKNFRSYAKNVSTYIKTNGIAATYAFIDTKFQPEDKDKDKNKDKNKNKDKDKVVDSKAKAWKMIYKISEDWLKKESFIPKDADLKEKIIKLDSQNYKLVTKEVLALFSWIRRFAVSELKGE